MMDEQEHEWQTWPGRYDGVAYWCSRCGALMDATDSDSVVAIPTLGACGDKDREEVED